MKALILLGGLGSRLRPLTISTPKPLMPILNRPLISYQIELLKSFGIRQVVLALGHKAASFKRRLGTGKEWGMKFIYSLEKEPLGTGGAIRHALPHLQGSAVILNGDVLSDFDLGQMVSLHKRKRADATLALVEVVDPTAFGLVETNRTGRIHRFLEKPSGDSFPVRTINAGCYVFEPRVLDRIPAGKNVSIEREIFPALLSEGFQMESYLHKGYWSDIGTLRAYWRTHQEMHEQKQWPSGFRKRGGLVFCDRIQLDNSVRVFGTAVVGKKTHIARSVTLEGKNTLGDHVQVGEGAHIQDSVILDGAHIGPRSRVERSIIGVDARVGADCRVGPDQVLGDHAHLPDFSQILRGLTEK